MNLKYFSEFEFLAPGQNKYWLPMIFEVDDKSEATSLMSTYKKALTENGFRITEESGPKIFALLKNIKSKFLENYISSKQNGILYILKANVWEIVAFDSDISLSFNDHLSIATQESEKYTGQIIAQQLKQKQIPVWLVKQGMLDLEDQLIINLVED